MNNIHRLAVYCGSASGSTDNFAAATRATAKAMTDAGVDLVYGGGRLGLMGVVADAPLAAGGEVIGVIPRGLVDRELAHPGLTQLDVVETLHERKARMSEHADAFVALPGGLGTLEELAEVLSWAQLDLHAKPIGLLDVGGYFAGLETFLDHAVGEGFLAERHRRMLLREGDIEALLERFRAWQAPSSRFARPSSAEPPAV